MSTKTAFERACICMGSQKALAKAIGVTDQAVSKWKIKVPAERCLDIEKATGGEVKCHELRPDAFPAPEKAAPVSEKAA